MLRLVDITVQLGDRVILDRVTFEVSDRERVAIVGRNGAGKTTLLRAAARTLEIDGGEVQIGRGQDLGFLAQETVVDPSKTLWESAFSAMEPVLELHRRAEALTASAASAEPEEQARLLHQAEELQERFRQRDGWQAEAACGRVLTGLGFERDQWHRRNSEFSGGWRVRIALAKLLLERPTFLLLDEPTNHLDLETRTWLLHELKGWEGAVVVIGHDRDFLDRIASRTVEVDGGGLTSYTGGYSAYLAARELRIEQLSRAAVKREEERARIQAFVDRFRYKASKASQVQDRVKQLDKLPRIVVPRIHRATRLVFPDAPPCGEPLLEVREVDKAYGSTVVLKDAHASVYRAERILLVGPNGAGKSTLLRLLSSREAPDAGHVARGPGLRIAYFAQEQAEELDPDKTVLQAVSGIDPLLTEQRLRGVLGSFLFSGDDVHKRCEVLSGGERSRVALVRIILARANLLLLDEPTNHLDIETKRVLADAMKEYGGSIVFVSHDRAFCDAVADRIWEVGGATVRPHSGNLDDFLWTRAAELGLDTRRGPGERAPDAWLLGGLPTPASADSPTGPEPTGKAAWKERKRQKAEDHRRRRRLEALPGEIEQLEARIAEIGEEMMQKASDWDRLRELQELSTPLQDRLRSAYDEWEQLEAES